LAVPMFNQVDDPISYLNKAMAFLIAVASSRVIVQQVQGRQGQSYVGTGYNGKATSSGGNNTGGRQGWLNVIIIKVMDTWLGNALSLRGLGMLHGLRKRQCWLKQFGQILDEEQLGFFADPTIPNGPTAQITIPNIAAFQTEDLNAYDSDCDDVSNAKAVLIANLSNYGSDVISEVPHFEPYHTDMDNQSVHAIQGFEQTPVVDFTNNEITSDSNIISYSQYLQETQQAVVQDTDFNVISSQHAASPVIDDEETLILEEVSRSKMLAKQNDPMSREKKVNTTPTTYVELNRLSENFGKRFVP
ncbi:hypothetical protein Tco_0756429, partial [Tanacetum coccineum]